MKKTNIKQSSQQIIFLLAVFIFSFVSFSCNRQEKDQKDKSSITTIDNITPKEDKWTFKKHVIDSILNTKNWSSSFVCKVEHNRDSLLWAIRHLEEQQYPAGALQEEVIQTAKPIVDSYFKKMNDLLDVYSLPHIPQVSCWEIYTIAMTGAFKDAGITEVDSYYEHDYEYVFPEYSPYGEARKQEINSALNRIYTEMKQKLYENRKNIEKKYAKYFPGGQKTISKYCIKDCEGGEEPGYEDIALNLDLLITTRSVAVYDSNLPVEFFADKSAKYKLESVSKGKWRVAKTTADGKKSYTSTFTHNTDFKTGTNLTDKSYYDVEPKVGDCNFEARPGNNMGVHISFSEVIAVEKPQAKYQVPEHITKEITNLEHEFEKQGKILNDYEQDYKKADSIATIMWNKKYADNNCKVTGCVNHVKRAKHMLPQYHLQHRVYG